MNTNIKRRIIEGNQRREWGSDEAICYICALGEGVEPCVYFANGVGKEGVGNNCPWFEDEDIKKLKEKAIKAIKNKNYRKGYRLLGKVKKMK